MNKDILGMQMPGSSGETKPNCLDNETKAWLCENI